MLKNNERLDDLQFNNLYIIQSSDEYSFTSDAIALANYVHVSNYGRVVDLCSGSGVIGILVNAKNRVKDVTLVEIQAGLADMSARSIEYNKLQNFTVVNKELQGIHKIIGENTFDVVVCNPPYRILDDKQKINEKENIAIARHEVKVTLEEIIAEASRLLKFGGNFYIVNQEDRLVDMLTYLRKYKLEPKEMKVLLNKKGNMVMLKAKKGGKCGIKILL